MNTTPISIEMPLEQMFQIFFGENLFNLKKEDMEKTDYLSLYDYLGNKAAGPKLGKQVNEYAKKNNIKIMTKQVNQGGYNGKVICYPPGFLHDYFIKRNNWKKTREQWQEVKQYFE